MIEALQQMSVDEREMIMIWGFVGYQLTLQYLSITQFQNPYTYTELDLNYCGWGKR